MAKMSEEQRAELVRARKAVALQVCIPLLREGVKKKNCFFSEKLRKGGGGVSPNPKFPYQKILRFVWIFFSKGGGVPPIPKGCYHKRMEILEYFRQKGKFSPDP